MPAGGAARVAAVVAARNKSNLAVSQLFRANGAHGYECKLSKGVADFHLGRGSAKTQYSYWNVLFSPAPGTCQAPPDGKGPLAHVRFRYKQQEHKQGQFVS
eukprot:4434060-Amphidinium_carterae.1